MEDRGQAARNAGILLLLAALATGVSVMARISADADQPTLEESLQEIATNTGMYTLAGVARLLSGAVLAAAAWQVWQSTTIREGLGGPLVPYLLVASGVITGVSGVCALVLAASVGLRLWNASRVIAAASVVIGLSMLLIWVDAATLVHRISGNAFFLWLVVVGVLLLRGTVERHLAAMRG